MRRLLTRILVGAVAVAVIAALPVSDVGAQQAISISKTGDLKFGSVVPDPFGSGKVTITLAGSRTCDAILLCFGTFSDGRFSVSGEPNLVYVTTMPGKILITDGVVTMEVDGFVDSISGQGTLDANGNDTFTVGAFLLVEQNQPEGFYTGTFTVIVNYN